MSSQPQAGQSETPDPDWLESARTEIDALDDAIIGLLADRVRLSVKIQQARIRAGGPRVMLSRERVIQRRYLDGLGTAGIAVADAVLRACRGGH